MAQETQAGHKNSVYRKKIIKETINNAVEVSPQNGKWTHVKQARLYVRQKYAFQFER